MRHAFEIPYAKLAVVYAYKEDVGSSIKACQRLERTSRTVP